MSITMKQIADMLGINVSTVSRALRNEPTISEEVKRKVLEIADKYEYRRRRTTGGRNIAFVIDRSFFRITSHFYNRVIEGIEDVTKKTGYIFQFDSLEPNQFTLGNINISGIAGMIVTSNYHDEFISEVKKIGIPLVLVDHYIPTENISAVLSDKVDGIIKGARYLSDLGHRRIAYLTGDTAMSGARDRLVGFQRAVEMFDLDSDRSLELRCDINMNSAYKVMKSFLNECDLARIPTAVMAVNDIVAMGAMEAIKETRLNIPEDLSVLGFDDIDLAPDSIPPLSTIRVRKKLLGQLAAKRLLDIIEDKPVYYNKILLDTQLIVRKSTREPKAGPGREPGPAEETTYQ